MRCWGLRIPFLSLLGVLRHHPPTPDRTFLKESQVLQGLLPWLSAAFISLFGHFLVLWPSRKIGNLLKPHLYHGVKLGPASEVYECEMKSCVESASHGARHRGRPRESMEAAVVLVLVGDGDGERSGLGGPSEALLLLSFWQTMLGTCYLPGTVWSTGDGGANEAGFHRADMHKHVDSLSPVSAVWRYVLEAAIEQECLPWEGTRSRT